MDKPIAIIGGGPGGLSAAIRAAELGLEVVLYEKGRIGDGIKCAEGFIDTLGMAGRPEAGVLFRVEKAVFLARKEHHVTLPGDCGVWMIDRSTWQKALAQRAKRIGVTIREDSPIERNRLSEMRGNYRQIIDASGAPSVTSKTYRFVSAYLKNASLLAQYVIEGDFGFLGENTIKAGYESHYVGYYWIFPKGKNRANVGVGRFNRGHNNRNLYLRNELERILKKEGIDSCKILKKFSSFCPSLGVDRLVWGNILLVGDAAALCSPLHGGGMDMACISGRMAAEAIASDQVPSYPARLWEAAGKKLTMEKRICDLWHLIGYPFLLGIMQCPWLAGHIIFNRKPIPHILGIGGRRMF